MHRMHCLMPAKKEKAAAEAAKKPTLAEYLANNGASVGIPPQPAADKSATGTNVLRTPADASPPDLSLLVCGEVDDEG